MLDMDLQIVYVIVLQNHIIKTKTNPEHFAINELQEHKTLLLGLLF